MKNGENLNVVASGTSLTRNSTWFNTRLPDWLSAAEVVRDYRLTVPLAERFSYDVSTKALRTVRSSRSVSDHCVWYARTDEPAPDNVIE
jgi:hypothetical protein